MKVLSIDAFNKLCIETFKKLPELPEPFSASKISKQWKCSHVTAKKRLLSQPNNYIQLSKLQFITTPKCNQYLYNIIMSSKKRALLIISINKLREKAINNEISDASRDTIISNITRSKYELLRAHSILVPLRIPNRKICFYFVPNLFFDR